MHHLISLSLDQMAFVAIIVSRLCIVSKRAIIITFVEERKRGNNETIFFVFKCVFHIFFVIIL